MSPSLPTSQQVPPTSPAPTTPRLDHLVSSLRADPSLQVFLSETFSPTAHVGTAVRAQRLQAALQDAQRASSLLSANVRQHVIRRKEALLAEVEAVEALEREVATVSSGVSSLVTATNALSESLDQPHVPMRAAVVRLRNLAAAAALVRTLQRFRACTGHLRQVGLCPRVVATDVASSASGSGSATAAASASSSAYDTLASSAEAVRELEDMLSPSVIPPGFDKLDGMPTDIIAVRKAAGEVRKRAAAALKNALAARDQTGVEAAVLAFAGLRVLNDRISQETARLLRETASAVHKGLEPPPVGHTFETALWANIERMLGSVADASFRALLLQHVLSRKYCNVTHMSLLQDALASTFIDSVARTIGEQVAILARTRMQRPAVARVFLTLAEGYPRLRQMVKDVAARLSAQARVSPTPIVSFVASAKLPLIPDHEFIENAFLASVVEIETHYLTASLERLTKSVNLLFQDNKQPNETDALNFAKLLASELSAARSDEQLQRTAISNVATAVRLYTSQAEDLAAATAPDDERTGKGKALGEVEQWRLTTMYNGMVALFTSATRVLGERDDGSGEIPPSIEKELTTLSRLSELLLDGPFSTCRTNVLKVLRRMHTEDLEGDVGDDGCSVYVLDISAQLSMFADGIIPGLARSRCLGNYTLSLAKWVLDTFVRHVSLVFPLPEIARMRLTTDMARIELAVESLCPARLLGKSYKALRALKSCILIPTEELVKASDPVMESLRDLPPSTVAHILFSRCSDDRLKHPHRRKDVAPNEYVEWLEKHSESEAWEGVELSLQKYKEIKKNNEENLPEYDAIKALRKQLEAVPSDD